MIATLETQRLILRAFRLSDTNAMAKINASKKVMRYFPEPYSQEKTKHFIEAVIAKYQRNQPAVHACILKSNSVLIGSVGVTYQNFNAYFTPCYEIGWRLDDAYWHQGYATEAAKTILTHYFQSLNFTEILSYTPVINKASIAVMESIGMQHTGEYFNHTLLPLNHPLSKQILYRISAKQHINKVKT